MAVKRKHFVYSPLPHDQPVTRLLRLAPGDDQNAIIQCKIFEYNLEPRAEDHQYEALSYVWGDQDDTVEIQLNDLAFYITRNLYTALRHLRDRVLERVIWVDAVCINQKDHNEKGLQIQFMASVFGYARQVIVWLGDAHDRGDEAFRHIHAVAGSDDREDVITDRDTHSLLLSLLSREWFRRIWVRHSSLVSDVLFT